MRAVVAGLAGAPVPAPVPFVVNEIVNERLSRRGTLPHLVVEPGRNRRQLPTADRTARACVPGLSVINGAVAPPEAACAASAPDPLLGRPERLVLR